ncbi:MAG: serine--tRNA ligase, partial [Clostridiales Family XIII bacterium]|nr:serine--tRNA ligase [Clostridiales Family XIII bacterium]
MLDIKNLRENFARVKQAVESRGQGDFALDGVMELDKKRRALLAEAEEMKNRRNTASKEISKLKKEKRDASALMKEMKELSESLKEKDGRLAEMGEALNAALLSVPNAPSPKSPVGKDDGANVEMRKWGIPKKFNFKYKAHWDVGVDLDILDFDRASKISGSRFAVYKGLGARLERSVVNFMLNLHTEEYGYTEILPPFMANRHAMTGTGQLPKFEEDMFWIPAKDFFLIPTAEVPLTNLHREEILTEEQLPVRYVAYTPCFRREAGSAGHDTRGLIRQHQFNKVELVKFVKPENSYDELESLLRAAEEVLRRLELPYRVVQLSTGDLGFASACTYDIEVWMPSSEKYVEISSCSNFEAYQARRAGIRFRNSESGNVEFLHTL